jgi:hypothetical protein
MWAAAAAVDVDDVDDDDEDCGYKAGECWEIR